jgi:hypothetical protein
MDTAVKCKAFPLPRRAETARQIMQLKNTRLVAVHLGIAAGGQSGDAGANDDD